MDKNILEVHRWVNLFLLVIHKYQPKTSFYYSRDDAITSYDLILDSFSSSTYIVSNETGWIQDKVVHLDHVFNEAPTESPLERTQPADMAWRAAAHLVTSRYSSTYVVQICSFTSNMYNFYNSLWYYWWNFRTHFLVTMWTVSLLKSKQLMILL